VLVLQSLPFLAAFVVSLVSALPARAGVLDEQNAG
jgi:hypothetical protein